MNDTIEFHSISIKRQYGAYANETTDVTQYYPQLDNTNETTTTSAGTYPTRYDVLNGRGQGIQRHPGNVKFRSLVFLNKVRAVIHICTVLSVYIWSGHASCSQLVFAVYFFSQGLYVKCQKNDKAKISKGIVDAIRSIGGRFLELNERTGVYEDIGDQRACAKTSQSLREGQSQIRKKMFSEVIVSNAYSALVDHQMQAIPSAGYFGYSLQLLKSLYNSTDLKAL